MLDYRISVYIYGFAERLITPCAALDRSFFARAKFLTWRHAWLQLQAHADNGDEP